MMKYKYYTTAATAVLYGTCTTTGTILYYTVSVRELLL